jgi:hypothetical protein
MIGFVSTKASAATAMMVGGLTLGHHVVMEGGMVHANAMRLFISQCVLDG